MNNYLSPSHYIYFLPIVMFWNILRTPSISYTYTLQFSLKETQTLIILCERYPRYEQHNTTRVPNDVSNNIACSSLELWLFISYFWDPSRVLLFPFSQTHVWCFYCSSFLWYRLIILRSLRWKWLMETVSNLVWRS